MAKAIVIRSSKKIHERFLSKGFFPPELPTCFYSETFGDNRQFLDTEFSKIPNLKNGNPDYYGFISNKTDIYFPRFGFEHRKHSSINPINYFFLSKEISYNWKLIKSIINKSKFSSSKPIFDPTDERAIVRPNFDSRDKFEMRIGATENYVLKTDVSRFFHSIYTHSIGWAIHGKIFSKKNRGYGHIGNVLDLLVRNSQDGQTIGIPVGPDTSRVVSEIIGSALDVDIRKSLPNGSQVFRFVDDFIVGASTREQGDRFSSLIRKSLVEFELDINHRKTAVVGAGLSNLNGWKEEIRSIAPKVPFEEGALDRFFYSVEAIAQREREKNVYHFALSRLRFSFLRNQDWNMIEDHLLPLARLDRSLIAPVCDIIITRNEIKSISDTGRVRQFVRSLIKNLTPMRAHGELTWLFHLCIRMSIPIKATLVKALFGEEDPFLAILISDMKSKGLLEGKIDRLLWNSFLNDDGLRSHMWLYAYEGTLKGLTGRKSTKFVTNHTYFKHLFAKKVEFYRSAGQSLSLRELMARSALNWQAREKMLALGQDISMDDDIDLDDDFGEDTDEYA